MRGKLVSILHEKGKNCSLIDDISIVKRYSDGSCNSIPVSSDDEALSRAVKEVCHMLVPFELCFSITFHSNGIQCV